MRKSIVFVIVLLLPAGSAYAFACLQINGICVHWTQGGATLRSFLGASPPLMNGTLSWDQNSINAANDWNAVGAAFRFTVTVGGQFIDPCGPQGGNHACDNTGPVGDNPVFFTDSFCGQGFGDIIELTNNCADRNSGAMLNAPVFVNSTVQWNAYDGPIVVSDGQVLYDIRRVLLHEVGHVLGLDHPDANGQTVQAIMNSRVGDLDRLQPDDIAGIQSLYPHLAPPTSGCQIEHKDASSCAWMLLAPVAIGMLRRRRIRRCVGSAAILAAPPRRAGWKPALPAARTRLPSQPTQLARGGQ